MPIFVAKTYFGKVESVVLADNLKLANAYWQGQDIYPHSIDERSEADLKYHPTGVLPIVTTKKLIMRETSSGDSKEYLVVV